MGIFKSLETKLEGLVEGSFGRAFKSSVQPVELAHKLAKEMGDHKSVGVANVYVPNEFEIYLGEADYQHLSSLGASLTSELSNYVSTFARREGWTLAAPPLIELLRDDDLRVGEFGIATSMAEAPAAEAARPAAAAPAVAAAPVAGSILQDQTVLYQRPAQPAGPAAILRGAGGQWELTAAVTVIGRSRRCDIVLADPNVSRQHAEIRRQGDGFGVYDLGSTNGTRVNRRDVKQAGLKNGDRIELGTSELRFEMRT